MCPEAGGAVQTRGQQDRARCGSGPGSAPAARLHRESLLHIPLLAQVFDDPGFRIVRRGIDARWTYNDLIAARVDGFNPLTGCAFIGAQSHLDRWLPHRHGSARPFNGKDELVPEALFVVHDYLHVWTYRWIRALRPELGFGTAPITRRNFEDMVFCHLLSEAVATVGLDYWYLSVVELRDVVPIGTLQRGLTVSYREAWRDEYRRFCPALRVQHPSFLERLTRFYCDGVFVGFDADDLAASPAIDAWITHELRYGQLQRRYCREWFGYLAGECLALDAAQFDAPLSFDVAWRKRLTRDLAERLWAKVKQGDLCTAPAAGDLDEAWSASPARAADFRFLNLNRCGPVSPDAVKAMGEDAFEFLLRQYAVRFDYDAFPDEAIGVFSLIRTERDFAVGDRLLKDMKRHPVAADEPRDLFLYN
jgi:hypothetical protein